MNIIKNFKKKTYKRNYKEMQKESILNIEQIEPLNLVHNKPTLKLNYQFNISEKYEINQLSYAKDIINPNKETINQFLDSLHKNEEKIYNNSFNKIIKESAIVNRKILGDGNCYFRALSYFFTHSENYKDYFRNCIYNYININSNYFLQEYPYIYYKNNIINTAGYIKNIKNDCFYAGELELLASAVLFKINILILEYIDEYKGYIQRNKISVNNQMKPILFLEFIENSNFLGHYNIIYIKQNYDTNNILSDIPIIINNKYNYRFLKKINIIHDFRNYNNKSTINNIIRNKDEKKNFFFCNNITNFTLTNNIQNVNKYTLIKNNENLKINNIDNSHYQYNDNINNSKENFNEIDLSNNNISSISSKYESDYKLNIKDIKYEYYPIYKNSVNGFTIYGDIHKYFLNRKNNFFNPLYPEYYNDTNGKKIFRNLCLNYELNKYNELCFKKLKKRKYRKNKNKIKNRHKKKNIEDYILLKIPYNMDYYANLSELHKNNFHCSFRRLIDKFNISGYTYKGLYEDAETIVKTCPICIQKERQFYKREPSKQIVFNKPKERYIGDITELPREIIIKTDIKYQFNIIDHFSKFGFSFLLKNKNAKTILDCIKECFSKYGNPDEFGSDNGKEFSNKNLNEYLKSNNIKFIHGKAYNPKSQGCVERLNRTLKIKLLSKYLDDKETFNIMQANNEIIFNYNNSVHSTTLYKPIEIFFSSSPDL